MYFPSARSRIRPGAGCSKVGTSRPVLAEAATSWFLAEGATGSFFDTYVLLGNPNTTAATITATYLTDAGVVVTKTYQMPPNSRLTINIEDQDPQLAKHRPSRRRLPPICRSLPSARCTGRGPSPQWYEAHGSFGLTQTATKWGLAEGRAGGGHGFDTFILLANPNSTAATVRITFLRESGAPDRAGLHGPRDEPAQRLGEPRRAGTALENGLARSIEVLNGLPIAVERAMYSSAGGPLFGGGTNATAVRIP